MNSLLSVPHLPNLEPRVFGCTVYVHIPKHQRNKLEPCAKRCVFVGYSDFQKGYRCYDPTTKKLHVTLDASFHESESYYSKGVSGPSLQGENNSEENVLEEIWEGVELKELNELRYQRIEKSSDGSDEILDAPSLLKHVPSSVEIEVDSVILPENESDVPTISESVSVELPTLSPSTAESTENVLPQVTSSPFFDQPNETNAPIDQDIAPRYPHRSNKGIPKKLYEPDPKAKIKYPINNHVSSHRLSESYALAVNHLSNVIIPSSVQDALLDPKWKKAMNEEMEALQKNETWELVPLPEGNKTVGCRWVFTVKLKADGSIDRYKARLVAKGYTQKYGVDYQETFAPVAKINTIRILISIAANRDWPLQQFDVKNVFLNGDLEEEVYMDLPPGVKRGNSCKKEVCKLKKSLYGLKQSPRAWFGRFSSAMKVFGYKQRDDPCEIKALQEYLAAEFEMKDLGQLKYFLGIEVARSKQGIVLSQRKYVLDLLTETGMLACKLAETPIEMNHKLGIFPHQVPTDKDRYQRLVGRLIYLAHTRPDIAYAVSVVSQFMHSPSEEHMNAVYRILRYLKNAP
ncbi:pentatricopeptide repeat-containing protein mitochondrial-like, partial [Trifolium pratense]